MDCKSICWQNDNTKNNAVCSNQDLRFSLKNMTTRRSKTLILFVHVIEEQGKNFTIKILAAHFHLI